MTAGELLTKLPPIDLHTRVLFQQMFLYVGENLYTAELRSGVRVLDPTDFKQFLRELADEVSPPAPSVPPQRRWDREGASDAGKL